MASAALLRACLEVIHFTGLSKALQKRFQGSGSIFCLHHVCPGGGLQSGFAPNSKLEITPEFLRDIILLVRARGMETISLAQAIERLKHPKPNQKPFVVFTLDDGYKDNLVYAQPIFDELQCPFTVFVAPQIVDGSCEIWWRALEKIIADNLHIDIAIGADRFNLAIDTVAQKNHAWDLLSVKLAKMPEHAQRKTIRELAIKYAVDLKKLCLSMAMTWDEIISLNTDPLCTIGAHTMNHYAVAKLSPIECEQQLVNSKRIISEELGEETEFFAYPYGDEPAAGPRDFEIANKAGYAASVTTRKGVCFAAHAHHLQALPRIMVSGRYQKLRYVDALISGVPTALLNRFRAVNVD